MGLHPLGARWIQEHYTLDTGQETRSYYGPINILSLNVGYHNEHHDLPSVPWNRLPKLTDAAPEFYRDLRCVRSLSGLLVEFLTDRRYSLASDKVRGLGWEPQVRFAEGLERTVAWYRENAAWWEPIRSGDYRAYYARQYGRALG